MKKLLLAIVVIVVAVAIGAGLTFALRVKGKYDDFKAEIANHTLMVVRMDRQTQTLLTEVCTNWVEVYSEVGGPHADALEQVELSPSVSSLIHLFTYRMPEYSLFSPRQNKQAATMGMIQAVMLPMSVDGSIHVSRDQHLAVIRYTPSVVAVYTDDAGGLREALYELREEPAAPDGKNANPEAERGAAVRVR